ncbi:hypothetical protein SALBM135S_06394 [Streptomyces alboniger]
MVAIEPERLLRKLAVDAARHADVPVDVVPGAAEALPVKSEAFDAAVVSRRRQCAGRAAGARGVAPGAAARR